MSRFTYILILIVVVVVSGGTMHVASSLRGQTQTDATTRVRGIERFVRPGLGTIVVCDSSQSTCTSYPSDTFVPRWVEPPSGPGNCREAGDQVWSFDGTGYVYVCGPPEYVWLQLPQPARRSW